MADTIKVDTAYRPDRRATVIDPERALLLTLVRDLSEKVDLNRTDLYARLDLIPTRRELDAVTESIGTVRDEFGKFVLRTEFALTNENLRSAMDSTNKANDTHFALIDAKISTVGQLPQWVIAVVIGLIINVSAAVVQHFFK